MVDELLARITDAAERPGITTAIWNDTEPGADERLGYLSALAAPLLADGRANLEVAAQHGLAHSIADIILHGVLTGRDN